MNSTLLSVLAPPRLLAALPTLAEVCSCNSFWAIVVGSLAVWVLLPNRIPYGKSIGGVLAIVAAGLFASDWPLLGDWTDQAVFWLLAGVTLGAHGTYVANAAASVVDGTWRIALGCVAAVPVRATAVEDALSGADVGEAGFFRRAWLGFWGLFGM